MQERLDCEQRRYNKDEDTETPKHLGHRIIQCKQIVSRRVFRME